MCDIEKKHYKQKNLENYLKELANMFRDKLSQKAYSALMEYDEAKRL